MTSWNRIKTDSTLFNAMIVESMAAGNSEAMGLIESNKGVPTVDITAAIAQFYSLRNYANSNGVMPNTTDNGKNKK